MASIVSIHTSPINFSTSIVSVSVCDSVFSRFSINNSDHGFHKKPRYEVVCTPNSTIMGTKGLKKQDPSEFNPLNSLEVISRQATINIGTIGHVAHGKSTVVRALTGVRTGRFKSELQRNQTIKLGYANAKIYRCENENCPRPFCFRAYGSSKGDNPPCDVEHCKGKMKLLRHVSFVDCPGHDKYMATMLSGAGVMDGALLVAAANENFPQPQTAEHLAAVDILGLKDIIVLQNKVDLVKEEAAAKQHIDIINYCQGTVARGAPVIPIAAEKKLNMDVLCEYIVKKIPVPVKDLVSPPFMTIIRSFDINKPGFGIDEIHGGVLGGTILKGVFKLNQIIEIRPGLVVTDKNGTKMCNPLYSRIVSLKAEQNELQSAVPGGLIGVGTTLDLSLARGDRLVGQVVGAVGSLPDVYSTLEVSYCLMSRLIGLETKEKLQPIKVTVPKKKEILLLNIGSMSTKAVITAAKNDLLMLQLQNPVCARKGDKIALSRLVEEHWRLIGWGQIQAGTIIEVVPCPLELI